MDAAYVHIMRVCSCAEMPFLAATAAAAAAAAAAASCDQLLLARFLLPSVSLCIEWGRPILPNSSPQYFRKLQATIVPIHSVSQGFCIISKTTTQC